MSALKRIKHIAIAEKNRLFLSYEKTQNQFSKSYKYGTLSQCVASAGLIFVVIAVLLSVIVATIAFVPLTLLIMMLEFPFYVMKRYLRRLVNHVN